MSLQFESKVSLGNILSISMIIITAVAGYTKLTESHDHLQIQVNAIIKDAQEIREIKSQTSLQEYQIRVVNEKLEEIKADVKEIKRIVK